jgi:hypothetical protein
LPGYSLLESQPGTVFAGIPFNGVPLGSFDFGSGPTNTGGTDTLVRRLDTADAPSETIPIELVALQLVSAVPVDFGAGLAFHYITLQSVRGGPASTGDMTINFGPEPPTGASHGTVDSFFDVFFDIRIGDLSGPIIFSDNVPFTSTGVPWSHFPPDVAVQILGVNVVLSGKDRDADFFPLGSFPVCSVNACEVVATAVAAPEPVAILLFGIGALGALLRTHRRHRAVR